VISIIPKVHIRSSDVVVTTSAVTFDLIIYTGVLEMYVKKKLVVGDDEQKLNATFFSSECLFVFEI
jgi:hypothetical protein